MVRSIRFASGGLGHPRSYAHARTGARSWHHGVTDPTHAVFNADVINEDYVRTAKAKGLSKTRIFTHHQLRNAILPVVTVLGPQVAAITTGGFVVEMIFAIPGLGRYFVQAVQQLDYTVIMGTTVFYGAFLVFMVIVVDILYGFIDPRVRLK